MEANFRLSHGGDVEEDGSCLFTAAEKAMGSKVGARKRTVARFLADLGSGGVDRDRINETIRHLFSPDLKAAGWCRSEVTGKEGGSGGIGSSDRGARPDWVAEV